MRGLQCWLSAATTRACPSETTIHIKNKEIRGREIGREIEGERTTSGREGRKELKLAGDFG